MMKNDQIERVAVNASNVEDWPDRAKELWDKHVAPRFEEGERCTAANYYTPRPYVDDYNRGSSDEGFVYILTPGPRVGYWKHTP